VNKKVSEMKTKLLALMVMVLLLPASLATGCSSPQKSAHGKMPVVVSILPLADLTARVGGDRIEISDILVPPGSSPHTFEPTPSQIRAVAQAKVLVLVGLHLEYWADKVIDASGNKQMVVVVSSKGISTIAGDAEGGGEGGVNPHVWLDPVNAVIMVQNIRDGLIQADPAGKAVYEARAAAYIKQLQQLDREVRQQVSHFREKKFIAFHPAWVYFAREYGLEQAAVVETTPGKEPSPAEIARIVQTAKALHAKAIFAEPQFSPKAAQAIAEESGAKVLFLDPLGSSLRDPNYINLIRYNVAQMAKALQ